MNRTKIGPPKRGHASELMVQIRSRREHFLGDSWVESGWSRRRFQRCDSFRSGRWLPGVPDGRGLTLILACAHAYRDPKQEHPQPDAGMALIDLLPIKGAFHGEWRLFAVERLER